MKLAGRMPTYYQAKAGDTDTELGDFCEDLTDMELAAHLALQIHEERRNRTMSTGSSSWLNPAPRIVAPCVSLGGASDAGESECDNAPRLGAPNDTQGSLGSEFEVYVETTNTRVNRHALSLASESSAGQVRTQPAQCSHFILPAPLIRYRTT